MKLKITLPAVLLLIVVALFIVAFIIADNYVKKMTEETEIPSSDPCLELRCPEDSIYVGSLNSDKYYACDCYYAQSILPENLICFSSDTDAISQNYIKSEC